MLAFWERQLLARREKTTDDYDNADCDNYDDKNLKMKIMTTTTAMMTATKMMVRMTRMMM